VSNSCSYANVAGWESVGGLAGENWVGGTLSNCYSTGSVTGIADVGGLVGLNAAEGSVSNSYASGSVTGNSTVGGLVATNDGTASSSFWDIETSDQATSAGGIGKTTLEMKSIATFSDADWDIITVAHEEINPAYTWNIVDGVTYPFLSWESIA